MRKAIFIGAMGLLLGATAYPAAAEVWQGDSFILARTVECKASNWAIGDFFRTVYRPANVGTNDASARLTLIGPRTAQRYFVNPGELVGSGNYTGTFITSMAGFVSWAGTFSSARTKPDPTPTTPTLNLLVKLQTFSGLDGCNVTLQGSLNLRPE
jgi:hypothetical protein